MKNEAAIMLACVGASLLWAAWRESRLKNYRDRSLLAACGVTFSSASAALALWA